MHRYEPGASDLDITVFALCQFFRREVPRLPDTYDWKIPKIEGFSQSGHSRYQPNLNLKNYLTEQWESSPYERKLRLAKTIVSDWGGVRANSPETLKKYVTAISTHEPPTSLQGVASYSKIYAIVQPMRFAIYDARVAACLNAVQINAGIRQGVAFNYVPGRNNIVGNSASKSGFTQQARFSVKELVKSGWLPVQRNQTYKKYLEILGLCLAEMPKHQKDYNLASLEMALFANAECECQRAMAENHTEPTGPCPKNAISRRGTRI